MYILKIKEVRLSKKMTQQDVSEKLNMTQQEYQRIESGKTSPGIKKLIDIALVFNVKLDDLITYK